MREVHMCRRVCELTRICITGKCTCGFSGPELTCFRKRKTLRNGGAWSPESWDTVVINDRSLKCWNKKGISQAPKTERSIFRCNLIPRCWCRQDLVSQRGSPELAGAQKAPVALSR